MPKPFDTVVLGRNEPALSALHQSVLNSCGRIEVVSNGGTCVLISKQELSSMEQALDIYANSELGRSMGRQTARVAHSAA
ncbi:MAG: hypothetical protein ACREJC_23165 [Tepidisphaeraceae bacterium]